MPENESLFYDASVASRWAPLAKLMDAGQSPTAIFSSIEKQLYAFGQKVWRQWKARGIDPETLFETAQKQDRNGLEALIKQANYCRISQLIREVASDLRDSNLDLLVRGFVCRIWEEVKGRLGLNWSEEAPDSEFSERVAQMQERISNHLIKNPSHFPKTPRRKDSPPDLDAQLGESLLY